MKQIRCELCNEDYDISLIRCYHARLGNVHSGCNCNKSYFICEDCVIHHKKYGWKLGEEITDAL